MDLATFAASWDWGVLGKILGANIILSGDNAVLIALAAAGLPAAQRSRAIMIGMVLAVVLRIVLSLAAAFLLEIPGIMLLGGLVLLWIAYGFYKETRNKNDGTEVDEDGDGVPDVKTMGTALRQIVIADLSMSLDNVLAVAGAAGNNMPMLIIGLVISILLMGVAASVIAKLLERYSWIAYVGVALILWIGVEMVWHDLHHFINFGGATTSMIVPVEQAGTRLG